MVGGTVTYHYLYGLAVKTPHGSQAMLLIALFTLAYGRWIKGRRAGGFSPPAVRNGELTVLLSPAFVLLVVVSSQLEFNHHVGYVLPVLGFVFVLTGVTARWFELSTQVGQRNPLASTPREKNIEPA